MSAKQTSSDVMSQQRRRLQRLAWRYFPKKRVYTVDNGASVHVSQEKFWIFSGQWHCGLRHAFEVDAYLCVEVGLVIRLHLLFGGERSVTTALKVVEEVQEGLQEIERE